MSGLTDNLDSIAEEIRQALTEKDTARERVLPVCREVIRLSSLAIRAVHRQEFSEASDQLKSARKLLDEAEEALSTQGEFRYSGYIRDAQKEFAEGSIVLALVRGKTMPSHDKLRVDIAPYLNGMGEAAGELRRYLLDSLRKGDLSRGEELLSAMDDIYSVLVTMDFPDAITGGLRHTTDMVRGVLERTRSDLTLTIRQKALEDRIKQLETKSLHQ